MSDFFIKNNFSARSKYPRIRFLHDIMEYL
nr:MAG TPA: microtubule-binding protein [Caudoviricetes sp.]DAI18765.1 MAG TPA: microtubule-binding protein [Caudoviricetes sp.]